MRFLTAVTTAPRKVNYLVDTLRSLENAGFRDVSVVCDDEDIGAWPNFKRALWTLLESAAPEDALIVFQDDIAVARGLADWLPGALQLTPKTGCVSLYCAGPNHQPTSGWHKLSLHGRNWVKAYGACALLMPADAARLMLAEDHRPENRTKTDMNVAEWCDKRELEYWFHSPSLVQHLGEFSAINSRPLNKYRVASHFVRDVSVLEVARG